MHAICSAGGALKGRPRPGGVGEGGWGFSQECAQGFACSQRFGLSKRSNVSCEDALAQLAPSNCGTQVEWIERSVEDMFCSKALAQL